MKRNMNGGNKHHFLENIVLLHVFTTFFYSEVSKYVFAVEIRRVSKAWSPFL